MDNELIIPELNKETIESMIYEVRGQRVMLDFDLAKIYGYSTKAFNQQVNRNLYKFPDRYRFQLTSNEVDNLVRSQIVTSRIWQYGNEGGRRYLPYAFTEQGIYMLMTVLKGELATKQSIALIDCFKQMKDYIVENNQLSGVNELIKLTHTVDEHSYKLVDIENKLEVVMDNFINPSTYKHYLIKNGERIESDIAYQTIYKKAKYSIYIIDDYIDIKTLELLKVCSNNINIIIFTDNKGVNNLNKDFINDYKKDTKKELIIKRNGIFHSRYIIIDYGYNNSIIYLCGGSSKDGGNSGNTIIKVDDKEIYKESIERLLRNKELEIK